MRMHILGGGPSLTPEIVASLDGRLLAINNAIDLAPHAYLLFAADFTWWDARKGMPGFSGLRIGMEPWSRADPGKYPWVIRFRSSGRTGLETKPGCRCLRTGYDSGYSAINLAAKLGAREIHLHGYDMQPGPDGQHHWHAPHHAGDPHPHYRKSLEYYPTLVEPLRKAGVAVVNCTPGSALTCFPSVPSQEAR